MAQGKGARKKPVLVWIGKIRSAQKKVSKTSNSIGCRGVYVCIL